MTWTYSNTSLSSELSRVRLLIGDTNTQEQLLTDEEINYFRGAYGDVNLAAAHCCIAIIAKLARDTTRSALGMSDSRNEIIRTYEDTRDRLLAMHSGLAEMTSTGDSVSAKETLTDDTDRVQPLFDRGRWNNATAIDQDEDS
jgi:hypothetical protein